VTHDAAKNISSVYEYDVLNTFYLLVNYLIATSFFNNNAKTGDALNLFDGIPTTGMNFFFLLHIIAFQGKKTINQLSSNASNLHYPMWNVKVHRFLIQLFLRYGSILAVSSIELRFGFGLEVAARLMLRFQESTIQAGR
ncbi:hypothetical protein ACJX0J_031658, partial [Zea mays]